jgi:hypothetical protein
MRAIWRIGALALSTVSLAFVFGCGGSSLAASSSCHDFLNASQQEQDEAVSRLAGALHAPNADTPLGRPNINYLCAGNPQMTLGEAVSHTG